MRASLAEQIGKVFWSDIRAHATRGALIVVAEGLDLAEVGEALARDEAGRVERWLKSGELGKPTLEQVTAWAAETEAVFVTLIVQPWVLVRRESGEAS